MIDLTGKTALVTGGSRGIGRSVCLMLAQAGADVAFSYRSDRGSADEVVARVEKLGRRALAVKGNMADPKACRYMFQEAEDQFGRVDIVVGNAGIWKKAPIDEMTFPEWREMIEINLDSIYNTCHWATKLMKRRKEGKLILVSSTAGQRGEAFHAHYAAAKGAIIALTRSLANELGFHNINVNCVAPGWVDTDMTAAVFQDRNFRETVEQSVPLRRIATPADIAGTVVFLASPLARHIQGEVINVNGGSVLC